MCQNIRLFGGCVRMCGALQCKEDMKHVHLLSSTLCVDVCEYRAGLAQLLSFLQFNGSSAVSAHEACGQGTGAAVICPKSSCRDRSQGGQSLTEQFDQAAGSTAGGCRIALRPICACARPARRSCLCFSRQESWHDGAPVALHRAYVWRMQQLKCTSILVTLKM